MVHGDRYDAALESFFSTLQKNVLDRRSSATREQLCLAIATWIERGYSLVLADDLRGIRRFKRLAARVRP